MEEKFKVKEYLENLRSEIDLTIEKYLPKKVSKEWVEKVFGKEKFKFSLRAIQKSILDPFWEFLNRGGKRWRPALFLLVLEALGRDGKKFQDFSIIPELAHNSSLIIDDIEDQSELRRGKPCLHKIFGLDIALNVGNFFYFFPIFVFEKNKRKLKEKTYLKVLQTYLAEMERLHLGQATDIFWHRGLQRKISEKEYFQMVAFKTGCMARLATRLAAILAEKEKLEKLFGDFGESLGIAFQIQDDILDITLSGEKREKFGKAFGNDIKEGKKSLPVIFALKKASRKDRQRLLEILEKHTDKAKEKIEAIKIIEKWGGIEYGKKKAKEFLEKALQILKEIFPQKRSREKLEALAKFLIQRQI
ncbi:polyprenyl synthetase family protein [Candidatus Parcubacteria bacterium]|nr:polyprenyl synthetase family protein [Candidatus Parcubacteria bacterium]